MNYFDVLNVSENAEGEIIRAAYKALAKKYHPDNTEFPSDIAKNKMQLINEAYSVLGDDEKRKKYLEKLHEKEDFQSASFDKGTQKSEERTDPYSSEYFYQNADEPTVLSNWIRFGIVISILCCIIYFMPDLLRNTVNNFVREVMKVINTF